MENKKVKKVNMLVPIRLCVPPQNLCINIRYHVPPCVIYGGFDVFALKEARWYGKI